MKLKTPRTGQRLSLEPNNQPIIFSLPGQSPQNCTPCWQTFTFCFDSCPSESPEHGRYEWTACGLVTPESLVSCRPLIVENGPRKMANNAGQTVWDIGNDHRHKHPPLPSGVATFSRCPHGLLLPRPWSSGAKVATPLDFIEFSQGTAALFMIYFVLEQLVFPRW